MSIAQHWGSWSRCLRSARVSFLDTTGAKLQELVYQVSYCTPSLRFLVKFISWTDTLSHVAQSVPIIPWGPTELQHQGQSTSLVHLWEFSGHIINWVWTERRPVDSLVQKQVCVTRCAREADRTESMVCHVGRWQVSEAGSWCWDFPRSLWSRDGLDN